MRGRAGGRRGQATVELALVLPLILVVVLGVVQVGLVVRSRVLVVHAAREAARAAAVEPTLRAARAAALAATSLDDARLRVTVTRRADPTGAMVEVQVSYRDPTSVPLVGSMVGDVVMTETVVMRIEPGP